MNTKLILCSAIAALLLPGITHAQAPQPARNRAARSVLQELIQEIRTLPPEERQMRLRELREQLLPPQGQPPASAPMQPGMRGDLPLPNPQRPLAAAQPAGDANRIARVLTPEQRQSMRQANQKDRDKIQELEAKLVEARRAVMEAQIPRNFNEAVLREKLEAAAKLNTEATILRARNMASIQPPLSDEQIEQIKNPPPAEAVQRNRPAGSIQPPEPGGLQPRNPLARERPVQNQNRPVRGNGLAPRL